MDINLNALFTILTNFKIKFTKDPSPTEISNMNLYFFVGSNPVKFNTIMWDEQTDSVVIEFEEKKM